MAMQYDDDMKRRLRRVEGQVRGILKMMEEEKNCKDVVSQLSAVRSAVDKTMAHIVAVNLEKCIVEEREAGKDTGKLVQEAVELLIKSR
ncbi:metal-sensitive transcriptional regulator [Paenibacillus hemerocallicola]|uniref:Metal-sensitive transcriptional regulator n=2 Tax=Paenibacillus hemerocallicola TaxID=1172614 RepID=A0A5C4TB97_9BACL|nr:metal-sensitive transcriptional regulator [Paenibacillus hemerocallicola]